MSWISDWLDKIKSDDSKLRSSPVALHDLEIKVKVETEIAPVEVSEVHWDSIANGYEIKHEVEYEPAPTFLQDLKQL